MQGNWRSLNGGRFYLWQLASMSKKWNIDT